MIMHHMCDRTEDGAPDTYTCGACGYSWCGACDPSPASLCHRCCGRGYSDAEVYTEARHPEIDHGATLYVGNDSYPYTVVALTRCTVTIRRCKWRVVERASEEAVHYATEEDEDGERLIVRRTKRGWSATGNRRVIFGSRVMHRTPYA